MAIEIRRLENATSREGAPEVFVEAVFDSETYGKLSLGHWLSASELAAYQADNSVITAIMEPYLATVEARKAEELLAIAAHQDEPLE